MAGISLGRANRKKKTRPRPRLPNNNNNKQSSSARPFQRPPPLQLLPDALPASPDTLVIPHPGLMSRSGGGGRTVGGPAPLRAPPHYPSSYLTSLAPPPALSLSLLPPALLALLSKALSSKNEKTKEVGQGSSTMQLSFPESLGAALGTLLALSAAALAGVAAAAAEVSLVSAPRRVVPRAEALAGAQLLALAALAPPPHVAAELVGLARAVLSGSRDFAAADSAAAVENSVTHLLVFSAPASEDNTSWGIFPLQQSALLRWALLGIQLWSLVVLWLPLTVVSPGAARGAAAAIDASVASAAGAAAARAEELSGPLSHWRDGHVETSGGKSAASRIPKLASEYWRPPVGAGTRTVLLAARADAVRSFFSFFLFPSVLFFRLLFSRHLSQNLPFRKFSSRWLAAWSE